MDYHSDLNVEAFLSDDAHKGSSRKDQKRIRKPSCVHRRRQLIALLNITVAALKKEND